MGLPSLAPAETNVYFSPKGGCQEAILPEISKARTSIDIAMYEFTSRELAQALVKAKERQVKIRITLDTSQVKDHLSKSRYLITKRPGCKVPHGAGIDA